MWCPTLAGPLWRAEHLSEGGRIARQAITTQQQRATPCTAPFMAAAMGYAITQPWYISFAVFEAVGLGRRNVYSGKQTTYAVSIGTRVLEDLSAMAADDLIDNFKITD